MRFKYEENVKCGILIVGGGGASLRAAIEARELGADVLVVSKSRIGYSNNTYISRSAFAATGLGRPEDGSEVHLKDTVIGGRFLNNQKMAAAVFRRARDQVDFLEKHGVKFARREDNIRLDLAPGHSHARHVRTDPPIGRNYMLPLRREALKIGVRFMDRVFISRLFVSSGRMAGAAGFSEDHGFIAINSKCVILTTGGFAQVYRNTNNAAGITGDGQALVYDLGLPLTDMEFVQFYPTAMGKLGNRTLLYEALVFRAGAILRNARGQDIVAKHGLEDPKKATRDRMAQAITSEINEGLDVDDGVVLDLSPIPEDLLQRLRPLFGTNPSLEKRRVIVAPTTHFCMGGVVVNERTETQIPGLFAAGEICGGVHGANRLGGNALTEVFVMGGLAARQAVKKAGETDFPNLPAPEIKEEKGRLEYSPAQPGKNARTLRSALKEAMWNKAGIIRDHKQLTEALTAIEELNALSQDLPRTSVNELRRFLETKNMLLVSEMVCRAALHRTESRGSHYRLDYEEEDNKGWLKNIFIRQESWEMRLEEIPVSFDYVEFENK